MAAKTYKEWIKGTIPSIPLNKSLSEAAWDAAIASVAAQSTSNNKSSFQFPNCCECKVRFDGCTIRCGTPTCHKKAVQKFDDEPETATFRDRCELSVSDNTRRIEMPKNCELCPAVPGVKAGSVGCAFGHRGGVHCEARLFRHFIHAYWTF